MSGYATAISAVVAIASAATSAVASSQQAQAQRAQAEYQSDMANYNAQVAEGNAQMAELEGQEIRKQAYEDSLAKRQEAAQVVGQQRAAQAASGAAVDVGSSLDLTLDTVEKGELDAMAIQEQGAWGDYNKRLEAWNYRSQGTAQSSMSEMYSNQAGSYGGGLSTAGTLLTGLGSAVGSSYKMFGGSTPATTNINGVPTGATNPRTIVNTYR